MQHYILQVVAKSEQTVSDELQQIGMAVTCPMTIRPWRNPKKRGEVKAMTVPVLPGYLAISASVINWPSVRAIKHVIRPIECGGEPQPVSEELVRYIAELEGVEDKDLPFRLHQRVRILDDVGRPTELVGTIAKIMCIKAELQLDRLGRATVDLQKLEAA